MKVGFAGLGHLGNAIASRLQSQGVDLTVWNRDKSKSDQFDAPSALSPAELIERCDVVFLCLFDSDAVDQVLNGNDGILSSGCSGKTVIDTTTNHFEKVKDFHRQVAAGRAHYLEAPVLGSVVPASLGKLVVVVSGEEAIFNKHKHLLDHLGQHIFYMAEPGVATQMKLINNMLLGAFMTAISEAVVLAEKANISREKAIEILAVGAGNSGVMAAKKDRLLSEDYSPHFSAELIHKDLRYLEELATSMNSESQLGRTARLLYDSMMNDKDRKQDFCAIYEKMRKTGK